MKRGRELTAIRSGNGLNKVATKEEDRSCPSVVRGCHSSVRAVIRAVPFAARLGPASA